MRDTLLFQTLQALTPDEFQRLGIFLESPLFNHSRLSSKCIALYLAFKMERANGSILQFSKRQAFHSIYPNKSYNQRLLDNVMSALLENVRQFIMTEQLVFSSAENAKWMAMIRFYRERNLDKRFLQSVDAVRRLKKKDALPFEASKLFEDFLLEEEVFEYENVHNQKKSDLNLSAVLVKFVQYCLAKGLELSLLLQHQKNLAALEINKWSPFTEKSISLARTYNYFDNPLIELLDRALTLKSKEANDEDFMEFLKLFTLHEKELSQTMAKQFAGMARHYCTAQINLKRTDFTKELLALYKNHLEKGLLYENGKVLQSILFNMVHVALREQEYDWAINTLESHRYRIMGSEYPEVVYQLIKSNCFFYRRNYSEAENALNNAFMEMTDKGARSNFKDIALNKMARLLEIKILYENDPGNIMIIDKLNSFKMFIHRNSYITKEKKQLDNNFVDIMKQLTAPATLTNKKRLLKLADKINRPDFKSAESTWLVKKIEELITTA